MICALTSPAGATGAAGATAFVTAACVADATFETVVAALEAALLTAANTPGDCFLYVSAALLAAEAVADAAALAAIAPCLAANCAPITAFFFATFAKLLSAASPLGLICDLGNSLSSVSPSKRTLYLMSVLSPGTLLKIIPFFPLTLSLNLSPILNPPI